MYEIEETHIDNIQVGDAILFHDVVHTVSGCNIKYCSFMGRTLFGDNYRSGTVPVKRIKFPPRVLPKKIESGEIEK